MPSIERELPFEFKYKVTARMLVIFLKTTQTITLIVLLDRLKYVFKRRCLL